MSSRSRQYGAWQGALLALLLLGGQALASDNGLFPLSLACPSGHVTWLEGTGTPGAGLLARFGGAPVGGGAVQPNGRWRIPLAVEAPAGIYTVEVVDRERGERIAAFTCFVDLPVGTTPTGTPTRRPTQPPTPFPTATATLPTTSAPVITATPAAPTPPPASTAVPTTAPSIPTPPASPVATAGTAEPTAPAPTGTTTPAGVAEVVLVAAEADDPTDGELWEYVVMENQNAEPQALMGWRLVHGGTGESYVFPALTLLADEQLLVWSGEGADDPTTSSLFWPTTQARWVAGDVAELYDTTGRIISTLEVQAPEPNLPVDTQGGAPPALATEHIASLAPWREDDARTVTCDPQRREASRTTCTGVTRRTGPCE